jgi:hypothetical protein
MVLSPAGTAAGQMPRLLQADPTFGPTQTPAEQPSLNLQPVQPGDLSNAGGAIPISGNFSLPISDGSVTVQVSYNRTSWSDAATTVPRGGLFGAYIRVRHSSSVYVRALWSGDSAYLPLESNTITFQYSLLNSSLFLEKLPAVNLLGGNLLLTGTLDPPLAGQGLSLTFIAPGGATQMQTVFTNNLGGFSASFRPQQSGAWTLSIRWEGNSDYGTLEKSVVFKVAQATIDCALSATDLAPGDEVVLTGYLSPPLKNAAIPLALNQPDGSTVSDEILTEADGSFRYAMLPQQHGTWGIQVAQSTDAPFQSDTCSALTFTVQGSILPGLTTVLIVVGVLLVASLVGSFIVLRRRRLE